MNELDYDALTLGNHEYDQGNKNVKRLAGMAQFPFLGANIIDEKTGERVKYAKPYIIKEIKGIRFGIFGLTTSTSICEGLRFGEVIPTAEECLKELEGKADIIIGLTHLGFDPEEKKEITEIDSDAIDKWLKSHQEFDIDVVGKDLSGSVVLAIPDNELTEVEESLEIDRIEFEGA